MKGVPERAWRHAFCFVSTAAAILLLTSVPSSASGAVEPTGKLSLSGGYTASLKLDHADCYSLPTASTMVNKFGVYDPSYSSGAPVFAVTVWVPSSKRSPHLGSVDVDVRSNGDQWEKIFEDWQKMPASEVHFTSSGKAGQVDVVLEPLKATHAHGTVHLVVAWKAGTCIAKYEQDTE